MTEIEEMASILDVEKRSGRSARELATARADASVEVVLHQALAVSGKTQRDVARELEVTEGRVSQILSGQSSLKVATLARYLRALGYQLEVVARPLTEGLPVLPLPKRNRRDNRGKIIAHTRTYYGANSPSRQIMFSLDKPHDGEGWTPMGEVEDIRGTYAPLAGAGRATTGARVFELHEKELQ